MRPSEAKVLSALTRWAWAVCLGSGTILITSFLLLEVASMQRTSAALREFERNRQVDSERSPPGPPTISGRRDGKPDAQSTRHSPDASELSSAQTLWSPERVRRYEAAIADSDLTAEGVLRIASVSIRVPIFEGTEEPILDVGAGRIEGTPPLGSHDNVGLAAHRDGHFRALKDLEIGAEIIVETLDESYRYEVFATSIVSPEDVYVLDPTPEARLTLVTCYPFYFVGSAPHRFIVHARGVGAGWTQ